MLRAVKGSCNRYRLYLEDQRQRNMKRKHSLDKTRIADEIVNLKWKKSELETESSAIERKIPFFEGQLSD